MWQVVHTGSRCRARVILKRRRLWRRSAPAWHGWRAKRYGPNAKRIIPRMPLMYWRIEGYRQFGWVQRQRRS